MNKFKKLGITLTALAMVFAGTMTASAAGRYNESKPLTIKETYPLLEGTGASRHVHKTYLASNYQMYTEYDNCMKSMVATVPAGHDATIILNNVKYSLRNYAPKGKKVKYTNVIKKIGVVNVPVSSLKISRTKASISAGLRTALTVTVAPSNATNKNVTWSSSNTSVATVSNGVVLGKKKGTCTITAKAGNKKVTCKVTVTAAANNNGGSGTFNNVSSMYSIINNWRCNSANQWQLQPNGSRKYVGRLKGLVRDAKLEKIAQTRAKESWTQKYVKKNEYAVANHIRPDGRRASTALGDANYKYKICGENVAYGNKSAQDVICRGWAETYEKYANQGHRRIMLESSFTKVGFASYGSGNQIVWVMVTAG